ncbi:unnamed protein product [Acanthoscelides obtectus]|uniref:Uncharacterized protein n=1 Tax=Acanthoscelides obtectus TaxID=200917 RepID=A0A9P0JWE9_ACAOB|nr:unnamed protein product [Acanthoscelides obtectus]CAK1679093.1 hypothetical protein AOBTE_LOCUS32124 [Acanthoscelides obtectus]
MLNRLLCAKGFEKQGLVCDCVPSCFEPEYNVVSLTKESSAMPSKISVGIQSLPTARFRRIVLKSKLDLVVSIGGTAGLFIGASLLSIVELVYLLFFGNKQ